VGLRNCLYRIWYLHEKMFFVFVVLERSENVFGDRVFKTNTREFHKFPQQKLGLDAIFINSLQFIIRKDKDGVASLQDESSENGTYLNGQRLDGRSRYYLRNNSFISLLVGKHRESCRIFGECCCDRFFHDENIQHCSLGAGSPLMASQRCCTLKF
jgi:hypothetical protein